MTQISGTAFLVNYLRSKNKELSGDIYLESDAMENPIFKGWTSFAKKNYNSDVTKYTYLTKDYFEKLEGYRVVDYVDYFDLEKRFTNGSLIRKDCDNVYPEDFIVLENGY